MIKYLAFFDKMWIAGLIDLKFFMKTKEASRKKTSQNNFFISQALHCENAIWNLQIFSVIFSLPNIFDRLFLDWCSTRPLISFTSFLQPAWIETGSVVNPSSALDSVQLDPNIIQKWNCAAGNLQIFLSEIIELQENGGGGGNLTQILYFPFYMGIAP